MKQSQETADFMLAAGIIATNWSQIEDLIEAAIWALVKLKPRYGRALTAHIGFVSQCSTLKLLLADKFPQKFNKDDWAKLLTRIDRLRAERNTIVHGRWESLLKLTELDGDAGLLTFEYKAKNSLNPKIVVCSAKYMKKVGSDIETLNTDIQIYLKRFGLSPSLHRPESQPEQTPHPPAKKKIGPRHPPKPYEG